MLSRLRSLLPKVPRHGQLGPIHWHRSNENENDRGEVVGSSIFKGRAWFSHDPEPAGPRRSVALEWCLLRHSRMCGVSFDKDDGERELVGSVKVPGVASVYVSLGGFIPRGAFGPARQLSWSIHDGALWWRLWVDPDSWESSRPRWKDGNWNPLDTFLGPTSNERRVLDVRQVEIPFPERTYRATVTLQEVLVRRARWPGVWERWRGADIEPEVPVPEPGKGENSWDCGQDATYSMWVGGVRDVHEAVERFRTSVNRTREKRGGQGWKPEEPAEVRA